jgi:large subunit ribosomal protein L4
MPKLSLLDMKGKKAGDIDLSADVFDVPFNQGLVHQMFCGLMANKRRGTASTKTRGEIRGGGRKPYRQKGTGMARHGSRVSPIFRGGGITFGPRPRSYNQVLPKKMRHGALRCVLSQRLRDESLTGISELELSEFKTRAMLEFFSAIKVETRKTLLVLASPNKFVEKSVSNIPALNVAYAENVNLVTLMKHDRVVATKEALEKIQEVLS